MGYSEKEDSEKCKAYLKEHAIYVRCPLVDEQGNLTGEFKRTLFISFSPKKLKAANIQESVKKFLVVQHYSSGGSSNDLSTVFDINDASSFDHDIGPGIVTIEPSAKEIKSYFEEVAEYRQRLLKETAGKDMLRESDVEALEKRHPEVLPFSLFMSSDDFIDREGRVLTSEEMRSIPGVEDVLEMAEDGSHFREELYNIYGLERAIRIIQPHENVKWLANGGLMYKEVQKVAFGLDSRFTVRQPALERRDI